MATQCHALVIAAPASGQGKTTLTATLSRYFKNQGKRVRVFKSGPDFLDPKILECASAHPVYQLDLWMVGESLCKQLLSEAAEQADIILIEGVMGLFDGNPSTADLAKSLNIPVLVNIDASAMAQTFAAIAYGLSHFDSDLAIAGVFANRIGSQSHYQMLLDALPDNLNCIGALPRQAKTIAGRHLGLVQAEEINDLDAYLDMLADELMINQPLNLPAVNFDSTHKNDSVQALKNIKIGIAKDQAFSFIYQANIDLLKSLGAQLHYFSPINDTSIPDVDSVYLPGGYPELHMHALSNNHAMIDSVKKHFQAGKPIVAECGGMLYLCKQIEDKQGDKAAMTGLIDAEVKMQSRFAALGLQQVTLNNKIIRGHTFHHSVMTNSEEPVAKASDPNNKKTSESVFQLLRLTASYIHFYFPSNPELVAELFTP